MVKFRPFKTFNFFRKEQGLFFFVPFLIFFIVFITVYVVIRSEAPLYIIKQTFVGTAQTLLPFNTTWWICFSFSKYVDIGGNEVFYVNDKIKIGEVFWFYGLFEVVLTLFFIIFLFLIPPMPLEWVRLSIQGFFFASMSYLLIFLIKNIPGTLLGLFCYSLATATIVSLMPLWLSYRINMEATYEILETKYLPLFIFSVICLAIGTVLNYKMEKYN